MDNSKGEKHSIITLKKNDMKKNPLVSVPVITYNSSETIVDTLDSIKHQTYQNIELIISDDCSTDNTVAICKDWIEKNKERFVYTQLLAVENNTGVSANVNRAWKACKGDWVKGVAGDDVLIDTCIQKLVKFITDNPNYICAFARMSAFGRAPEENVEYVQRVFNYDFFQWSYEKQKDFIIYEGNCLPAPTFFFNRKAMLEELNISIDERIPMIDDVALWINLLRKGVRFGFMNKKIVLYRLSDTSVSTTHTPSLRTRQSIALIYLLYRFKYRFKSRRYNKLGEIRKYIYAANTAYGGKFWKLMICADKVLAVILKKLGLDIKLL